MAHSDRFIVGIDVGGTNTDAVVLQTGNVSGISIGSGGQRSRIVSAVKTRTTADFITGIQHGIAKALQACNGQVTEHDVSMVMIGTTVFLNAVLQSGSPSASDASSPLAPVVCIRLCGRLTRASLPLSTFPANLARQLRSKVFFVDGGFEFDKQPVAQLDEGRLQQIAQQLAAESGEQEVHVALSGVFAPLYNEQELRAAQILQQEFEKAGVRFTITMSHKIGQVGFIERENAAILNASLRSFAIRTMSNLRNAIAQLGLDCGESVYLTQNDGTLITLEEAMQYPVLTFSSGPVNSLRGASALTSLKDAIVVDIGGTSSDVAVLTNYFPRPAGSTIEIGGVRTNFRMPDVFSIGLGGGSLVQFSQDHTQCHIGPASVGYKLTKEALCFGGKHLTITDVAIAGNLMRIEGADASKVTLTDRELSLVQTTMISMLERAIDKMKTSKQDVPLVLVGGGSALLPEDVRIAGVSAVHRPVNFAVANALGAAMAQISITLEEIHDLAQLNEQQRAELQLQIAGRAKQLLVAKGASSDQVEFVHDKVHISYALGECFRFVTKAIGYIDMDAVASKRTSGSKPSQLDKLQLDEQSVEPFEQKLIEQDSAYERFVFEPPKIIKNGNRREWILSAEDVECIAVGAGICACGGGGSTYLGRLEARQVLQEEHVMRVIDIQSLQDDDQALFTACYGAPFAIFERISTTEKAARCFTAVRDKLKVDRLAAVYCVEIGGLNSIVPLCVGARLNLPVLDCDAMGRAYPQLQMATPFVYGQSPVPCCLSGEYGEDYWLTQEQVPDCDAKVCEQLLRKHATLHFGLDAAITCPPLSKQKLQQLAVKNTMSRVWRLGRIVLQNRKQKGDIMKAIEQQENAKLLFVGKITDLTRMTQGGYNKGVLEVTGLDEFSGRCVKIDFMNENLLAYETADGQQHVLASVPDLISIVDLESFQPVLTEELRYGLRVRVLALPAHPLLCTPEALEILGPAGFGYSHNWQDCSLLRVHGLAFRNPQSVFDEFPDS